MSHSELLENSSPGEATKSAYISHYGIRARRYKEMMWWYQMVFCARIQHENEFLAFMTLDCCLNERLSKKFRRSNESLQHYPDGFDLLLLRERPQPVEVEAVVSGEEAAERLYVAGGHRLMPREV